MHPKTHAPRGLALLALALVLGVVACKAQVQGKAVTSIDIVGNDAVSDSYLRKRIATTKAPKFLGLLRVSWIRYEPFEPLVLARDLERIERAYQRLGYYNAHARVARVVPHGRYVDVQIVVEEGRPVTVRQLRMSGIAGLPAALVQDVNASVDLARGEPFDEGKFESTAARIETVLHDAGYAYARVEQHAEIDLGPMAADVSYRVIPGIRATIGPIRFDGLDHLPEAPMRRAFAVEQGDPYSAQDLENGRLAMLRLGVISSAEVVPDLSDPTKAVVPLLVRVTQSRLTSIRAGGGAQLDSSRTEVHGVLGWQSRNLLGALRRLTLEERPSVVFFPTAVPDFLGPSHLLFGNRASVELRQPAFLEGRTDATLGAEYDIYPVLLAPLDPNAQVVIGYHEVRGGLGIERPWQPAHLLGRVGYNLEADFPFAYFGNLNPELTRLFISNIDLNLQFDVRDDPVRPHNGFLLTGDLQFAGGALGGSADDIRFLPSWSMYIPFGNDVTLATRLLFGFLFPRNYAQDNVLLLSFPQHPPVRDLQIMYFRGLFSGGPNSNRGYGFHDIGPHGLAIFNISDPAQAVVLCNPANPNFDERLCSSATGGLTLWEASTELRYPITGPLGAVTFVDMSDVSTQEVDVRLSAPHLSVGVGIRYATPVGPVRADLGFRIPGAQFFGEPPPGEGPPPKPLIWNIPVALWLGIGEAY